MKEKKVDKYIDIRAYLRRTNRKFGGQINIMEIISEKYCN